MRNTPQPTTGQQPIAPMVVGLMNGDPGAAAALYAAFGERIYAVAVRQLRSPADAEDVRGETLIRVVGAVRAGRLESPRALPGFVLGTARNVIREAMRRRQRAESIADRDFASSAPEAVDHTIRRAIEAALAQLRPRERDVVRYCFYDELPKEEISRRLGIHCDRVRLVKSRALKSFKEAFHGLTSREVPDGVSGIR